MGQSSPAEAGRKAAVVELQVNCVSAEGKKRGGCRCGKYLLCYIRSEAASSLEKSEMNNDGAKSPSS